MQKVILEYSQRRFTDLRTISRLPVDLRGI